MVVDDEPPARWLLSEMLGRMDAVEVVRECANGFEALKAAEEARPDAVFLDIEMPRLNGLEVAELLDPSVAVVFVTAYDEHAVRAFEANATDYVLKPFREERLRQAVERARTRAGRSRAADSSALAAAMRLPGEHVTRIVVRDGSRVHVLPAEDLVWARAQDDYVLLKAGGREYLKQQTLASLAESLDPARFLRVHRSWLVNVDRLRAIELAGRNTHVAVLADGSKVPVSREGHAKLKALLEEG
jgi:two-component system LytT family response regulator